VTDLEGNAVHVTKGRKYSKYGKLNIILWADHCTEKRGDAINATGSEVLKYVGGSMSAMSVRLTEVSWSLYHLK
jgi:ribulose kinase